MILIPSLINPPNILDLGDRSLAAALARDRQVLLLDWGPADRRRDLDLDGHVRDRLLPLLAGAGPVDLVGYCLGGTLALRAAAEAPDVRVVVTLAAPHDFSAYPAEARHELVAHWRRNARPAKNLGALPMEVLQAAFWQIDPDRIVAKFARFAAMEPGVAEARNFVALEDWANGGEPLPLPAARQLVEDLFGAGRTLGPLPGCPMLHVTAANDRIAPAETAARPGDRLSSPSGHVGMLVGRHAPRHLHAPVREWLEANGTHR